MVTFSPYVLKQLTLKTWLLISICQNFLLIFMYSKGQDKNSAKIAVQYLAASGHPSLASLD